MRMWLLADREEQHLHSMDGTGKLLKLFEEAAHFSNPGLDEYPHHSVHMLRKRVYVFKQ